MASAILGLAVTAALVAAGLAVCPPAAAASGVAAPSWTVKGQDYLAWDASSVVDGRSPEHHPRSPDGPDESAAPTSRRARLNGLFPARLSMMRKVTEITHVAGTLSGRWATSQRLPAFVRRWLRRINLRLIPRDLNEYVRRTAHTEQVETTPPADETVRVTAVWVIELYTPSSLASLLGRPPGFLREALQDDRSFHEWLAAARKGTSYGRSIDFSPRWPTNKPRLPAAFSEVRIHLASVTSAITAISAAFAVAPAAMDVIDRTLRNELAPITQILNSGYIRDLSVKDRKIQAATEAARALRSDASTWVRRNLPGLFSNGLLAGDFPSMELIVTKKARPLASEAKYMNEINLGNQAWDRWRSTSIEGLGLTTSAWAYDAYSNNCVLTLGIREADLIRSTGGLESASATILTHESDFGFIATRWAIGHLIRGTEARLARIRDSTITEAARSYGARKLMRLERDLLLAGLDAQIVAEELADFASDERAYMENDDAIDFEAFPNTPEHQRVAVRLVKDQWRRDQAEGAKRLAKLEEKLREVLVASIGINVSATGIVLQWRVLVVAVVSLVISTVAVIVSLHP